MKKMNWLWVLSLTALMALGAHAQQLSEGLTEARGKVEQWAPGASVIKVSGVTYTLSKETQVLDSEAALLTNNAVRPGSSVLLMMDQGVVTHVVVNPGSGPVMDQPQR